MVAGPVFCMCQIGQPSKNFAYVFHYFMTILTYLHTILKNYFTYEALLDVLEVSFTLIW